MVGDELTEVTRVFNYWNNLGIKNHRKMTSDIRSAIERALKDYTLVDIETAINNYAIILISDEYYFKYRWTLSDFLNRRKHNNIERFLDLEIAKSNFKKDNKNAKINNNTAGNRANGAFRGVEG